MELQERLRKIQVLLLDVDGILTDTKIFYDGTEWRRFFSIRDGSGLKLLQENGVKIGFITGSKAQDIRERAKMLSVDFFHEGALDKTGPFDEILKQERIDTDRVAYMGDDYFDLPILKRVGFAATVPEAGEQIRAAVHYVTMQKGGSGAVREVCDMILQTKQSVQREQWKTYKKARDE